MNAAQPGSSSHLVQQERWVSFVSPLAYLCMRAPCGMLVLLLGSVQTLPPLPPLPLPPLPLPPLSSLG